MSKKLEIGDDVIVRFRVVEAGRINIALIAKKDGKEKFIVCNRKLVERIEDVGK